MTLIRPVNPDQPVDFDRGSSPMWDKDAFGHMADKLGEISDGLRGLAYPMGLLGARRCLARVLDNMTMLRDAMRAAGLLRGQERWIEVSKLIDAYRDQITHIATVRLPVWPTDNLMKLKSKFDAMKVVVEKLRNARETQSAGWTAQQ